MSPGTMCVMHTRSRRLAYPMCLILVALGCGDRDQGVAKSPKQTPANEPPIVPAEPPGAGVAEGESIPAGPVPPNTSMAFYVVEGALVPLGCWDKDKHKLAAGKACLPFAPKGTEVLLGTGDGYTRKTIEGHGRPTCEPGEGDPTALTVSGLDVGANQRFAVWPPSAATLVELVSDQTKSERATKLPDDERTIVDAAIEDRTQGKTYKVHQRASADVDGDGQAERFWSVYVPGEGENEAHVFSALLMAPASAGPAKILLETKSKPDAYELRGTVDLEGDKKRELWLGITYPDGGGDRLARLDGGKLVALGEWTCGA